MFFTDNHLNLVQYNSCRCQYIEPGNTKGGSITVPSTSCLTGLDESVLQIKTKNASCHTADSKPVKQEVNSTVILPPLVFPDSTLVYYMWVRLEPIQVETLMGHHSKG